MFKVLKAAVVFGLSLMAQPSMAEMAETRRSQNAEARHIAPLNTALREKSLLLGNPGFSPYHQNIK